MKILPSAITLKRGPLAKPLDEKGVKLYYDSSNNIVPQDQVYAPINSKVIKAKAPTLSLDEAHTLTKSLDNWFVIAGANLIIIDTDSEAAEEFMRTAISEAYSSDDTVLSTYRVESDTNFSHYYYTPTEYFTDSALFSTERKALREIKIDILQGGAGAWGPGKNNYLKFEPENSTLLDVQPIPNSVVDALLIEYNKEEVNQQHSDYSPFVHHIGVQLDKAFIEVERIIAIYEKIHNTPPSAELWEPFHDIASYIIPNKYKSTMVYPWDPDTIPIEASSNAFVQSLVSKLLRDNSISADMIEKIASLITTQIWSRPITHTHCLSHMNNLRTQTFGDPPISYAFNADLLEQPTVCLNGGAARPIYRNTKGNIVVEGAKGLIDFGTYKTFSDTMRTKGYEVLPSLTIVKRAKEPTDLFLSHMRTITPINTIAKPTGLQSSIEGEQTEFNIYTRETLHNIILGLEQEPSATQEDFPTIMKLLRSVTADHAEYEGEQERLIEYFNHLMAHKAKTFTYSPLVIQMNGKGGRGKGALTSLLDIIFGKMYKIDYRKADMSNIDKVNALFGTSAEVPVTHNVEEKIKDESGDGKQRSRALYSDAVYTKNITTLMVSTNMKKLFQDSRRFVLFSCFESEQKFTSMDYAKAISELRRYCAYLRDLTLVGKNKEFLTDSTYWNGKVQAATVELVAETDEASSLGDLYKLYTSLIDLSGADIHNTLGQILGINYWQISKDSAMAIHIVCYAPGLTRDDKECPHTITGVAASELGMKVVRNTTSSTIAKQGFSKSYSYIKFKLSREQYKEYSAAILGITTKDIAKSL